jgi:ABC-2 type transport system permease protein
VTLLWRELGNQQRLFWRSRELAFFTFLLPIVFFVLLGSVYGDEEIEGVEGSAFLLAGMLGYGLAATAFAGLSIVLVIRREDGILKRLRATPLPGWTLVAATLGSTLIAFVIEAVLLVALARLLFDVPVPSRLFSLALLLLLGGLAFSALGLAVTTAVRSAEGSSAAINAIYLPMTFLSGSFFSQESFPRFLQVIAELFPLTYFIELAREVVVDGDELWQHAGPVAIVAAWGAFGALVTARRFRWEPHER